MAERLNAPVLKTGVGLASTEGSNPSLSAKRYSRFRGLGCDLIAEVGLEPSVIDYTGSTDPSQADRNGRRPARRVSPRKRANNPSLSGN